MPNSPNASTNSSRRSKPGVKGAPGILSSTVKLTGRAVQAVTDAGIRVTAQGAGFVKGLYNARVAARGNAAGNAARGDTNSRKANAQGSPVRNTATSAPAVWSPRRRRPFSNFLPKIRPSKTARLTSKTGILTHQIKEYENRKQQLRKLEQEALSDVDDFLGKKIQNIHTEIARRRLQAEQAAQKKRDAVQKRYASAQREMDTLIEKAERTKRKLQAQRNARNARQKRRV